MNKRVVHANPTKEFFVKMLVRDIMLKQAIIELIDNSIDGAKKISQKNDYSGLKIEISFDKNRFSIKDNCGGIPLSIAEDYAFRFGRPEAIKNSKTETTGIFGIGMKRSLFKMGNYFTVKSITKETEFLIELDVHKWEKEDDKWDFEFASYSEGQNNDSNIIGTEIIVENLNKDIASEFSSTDFEKELKAHIERRVGLDIAYGMEIKVNEECLAGNNVIMTNDDKIKPIKEKYKDGEVDVEILCGIAPKEANRNTPEKAGWYIYCNGRLVVAADKTSLTTWRDIENKSSGVAFHNNYAAFRGVVMFNSKTPDKLPWNTTKTGLDETSRVYLQAREKMLEVFKIVRMFIDEIKTNTRNSDDGIEETIEKMETIELTTKNAKDIIKENRKLSIKNVKVIVNPNVTITYKKPKSEVQNMKDILGVSSNKEVGEKTFEYYKDAEC